MSTPSAAARTSTVLDTVRGELRRLADRLVREQAQTDPLVDASVACLEAAESICAAIAERHGPGHFDRGRSVSGSAGRDQGGGRGDQVRHGAGDRRTPALRGRT
ncbi:MAG: hypothetical protein ACRDTC_19385 [Pseudonocardiaceae bacterium]